jgi:hypothetical protein
MDSSLKLAQVWKRAHVGRDPCCIQGICFTWNLRLISANTGNLTLRATNSYPGMASIDFAVGADIVLGGSEDALVSFPGNAVTMSHGMWEMRWEVSQPIQRVWAGDAQTLWHCDWVSGSAPSQEMARRLLLGGSR